MRKSILVAGGDLRQVYAANHLAEAGCSVTALGFGEGLPFTSAVKQSKDWSALSEGQTLLLPLTISREHWLNTPLWKGTVALEDCLRQLSPDCEIYGGNVTEQERQLAERYGHSIRDFFRVEALTAANALLTAEGAIQLAMEQQPAALWRKPCLICGYGRIGRALMGRLKSFGAKVTVAARKAEQRTWAEIEGATAVDFPQLPEFLPKQQLVFNTIPQAVLGEKELSLLSEDCLLLELASKPYGIDLAAAQKLDRKAILASGLPGKCCPQTAGQLIADTILNWRDKRW